MFSFVRAVFGFADKHYLLKRRNPIRLINIYPVQERTIGILSPEETRLLITTARDIAGQKAAALFAIMAYAGIRPFEAERLTERDVDLTEGVIYVDGENSKTGGARQVEIRPALREVLTGLELEQNEPLRPPNMRRRRAKILKSFCAATGKPWQQDCLRHGFATYHAKLYKNVSWLMLEMGHSTPKMLFERYLNARGITMAGAADYFGLPVSEAAAARTIEQRNKGK